MAYAPDNKTYNKQSLFPPLVSSRISPTEQKLWLWQIMATKWNWFEEPQSIGLKDTVGFSNYALLSA